MKFTPLLLTVLLSASVAFGVVKVAAPTTTSTVKETAFERVIRTNTLRCAYLVMPPQFSRDPNTGAFSGVSYDIVMEAAKRLSLKVDWVEEVNFMTVPEGFKTNRYDSFCFSGYRWTPWSRVMEYTSPLFYSTTSVYVRADDHRFDANLKAINNPSVKIVISDGGEASAFIREADFPLSSSVSLPANIDHSLMLETVATKKADVALFNPLEAMPYLVSNPDKLRRVESPPIRAYAHALSFAKGEHDLTSMFDVVLNEMSDDGTINKVLDKYELIPHSFVRIKSPVSQP
ncbi:MAG: transporter substrate-binding domain-containing protein [Bdellovibrionales bacterium]|jgi:ABC-type amino acid transport substrate-binding protein